MTDQHDSQKQSTFDLRWQRVGTQYNAGHNITIHEADTIHDVRGLANPYLGLAAFTYAERAKYAGRARHIREAVAKLITPGDQQVLLFVTGASGSGKSSFAQAGLIPALEHHYAQRHHHVRATVFRPSTQPLAMLADVLQQFGIRAAHPGLPYQTFYRLLKKHTEARQVNVIIIDQFEELFTQSDPTQRDAFFAILEDVPPFIELRTHLIATVRADYLPELFRYHTLYNQAKRGIDLRVMAKDELKQAIQQPLHQHPTAVDKRFEDALLNKLAADSATNAAYLPLLQATLARLWGGGILKLSGYGSLADAIQQQAEDVYVNGSNGLPRSDNEQRAILALLLELVDVSPMEDDRRDVRRRRTLNELVQGDPKRRSLVTELATARLLSTEHETRSSDEVETVDIIHESLLSNWTRLRDAIDAERETLQQRARFELALYEWQANEQQDDYLLTGVRLSEAEALDAQGDVALRNPAAQELLKRSVAQREMERKKQLRRLQVFAAVLGALLVLALGAGWFAFEQQGEAQTQAAAAQTAQAVAEQEAERAESEAERADQRAAAAEALRPLLTAARVPSRPDLVLALSMAALRIYPNSPQAQFMLSEVAYAPGMRDYIDRQHVGDVSASLLSQGGGRALIKSCVRHSEDNICLDDETILFDITNKQELTRYTAPIDWNSSNTVFTPDEDQVLSALCPQNGEAIPDEAPCTQLGVLFWNVTTGQELRHVERYTLPIIFSPDGQMALSAGTNDNTIRLWNSMIGDEVVRLEGHTARVIGMDISQDGRTVLSISRDNTLRLWDIQSGQELRRFDIGEIAGPVSFGPDEKTAFIESGTHLRAWSLETGQVVNEIPTYAGGVYARVLSPDGSKHLTGSRGGGLTLRDLTSPLITSHILPNELRLYGHNQAVSNITFSRDGQTALVESSEGLRLWDLQDTPRSQRFEIYKAPVIFVREGQDVLSGSEDGSIRLWNVQSGNELRRFSAYRAPLAVFPDGQTVLSGSEDGSLRLWSLPSGDELRRFGEYDEPVVLSPDGQVFIARARDADRLHLVDTTSGQELHHFAVPPPYSPDVPYGDDPAIVVHPDGQTILAGLSDGTVRLWDVESGEEVHRFNVRDGWDADIGWIVSVAFSPDSQTMLSTAWPITASAPPPGSTKLQLWDIASGEELRRVEAEIDEVVFRPDGQTFLRADVPSGQWPRPFELWNAETWQEIRRFGYHSTRVRELIFSPDGRHFFSSNNEDGTLVLWHIDTAEEMIEWVCTNRYMAELTPEQRQQYGIPEDLELCPAGRSLTGKE